MSEPVARVVIVNYNGGEYLADSVNSVRHQTVPCELVVVDNASTDGSLATIADFADVTIVRSPRNLGFGGGVNLGARGAVTPFVATLNADAVAGPEWLEHMLTWMTNERIDIGTCLIGASDTYYFAGGTWNRWRGAVISHATSRARAPDWINGCALIIRRALFERLKGFDDRYFLYCEDVDLSLRARAAGAKLGILSERLVEHEQHGRSAVGLGDRKMPIAFVSRGRLVAQHVPALAQPFAILVQAILVPAVWSRSARITLQLACNFARGFAGYSATPPGKAASG